jgi:transposase
VTIGLDLGDRWSEACAIDADGEVVERLRIRTTAADLERSLARFAGARVVMEAGTHSPWVSRALARQGFEVVVANPRRLRLISASDSKSDGFDAEQLARLGRVDVRLLSPIVHRGERAQRDLIWMRARDGLVRARTQLINQVRGFAKSLGTRLPASSAETFAKRMRAGVDPGLFPGLRTLVDLAERHHQLAIARDPQQIAPHQRQEQLLRGDRGASGRRGQRPADPSNRPVVDQRPDPPQRMLLRHERLQRQVVKHRPLRIGVPHHRIAPPERTLCRIGATLSATC